VRANISWVCSTRTDWFLKIGRVAERVTTGTWLVIWNRSGERLQHVAVCSKVPHRQLAKNCRVEEIWRWSPTAVQNRERAKIKKESTKVLIIYTCLLRDGGRGGRSWAKADESKYENRLNLQSVTLLDGTKCRQESLSTLPTICVQTGSIHSAVSFS